MVTASGLRRIGQGREAEIFLWPEGGVLKLYRDAAYARSRDVEAAAMAAAKAAGAPAPGAIARVEVDGRPGLVMERVAGVDLLTQSGRKPWTVASAGYAMGVAHARLHAVTAPPELPALKERARARSIDAARVPDDLRARALAALDMLPDGAQLLHGDFHPGNVIVTDEGAQVIDWPNAAAGDPDADIARTLLTLRIGEPPEGTPALVRALIGIGRRVMTAFYTRGYRSQRAYDAAAVERWMAPVAIFRLQDGIEEERARLLRIIDGLG